MIRLRPTASDVVRPRRGRRRPGRACEPGTFSDRNGHAGHRRRGAPLLLPAHVGVLRLWRTRLCEPSRRRVVPTPRQAHPAGMASTGPCAPTGQVATYGGCYTTVPLRRSGGALLPPPRSLCGRIPPPRRHGGPQSGTDRMRGSLSLLHLVLQILAGSGNGSGREGRRALPRRRSGARDFISPACTPQPPVSLLAGLDISLSSFLRWHPNHR